VPPSLSIRLETEQDHVPLLETMNIYNKARNFVAERAFVLKLRKKYKFHKVVYQEILEIFGLSVTKYIEEQQTRY
jgi:predicted transposase